MGPKGPHFIFVAEREGFEPPVPARGQRISSAPRSTTPAPLRWFALGSLDYVQPIRCWRSLRICRLSSSAPGIVLIFWRDPSFDRKVPPGREDPRSRGLSVDGISPCSASKWSGRKSCQGRTTLQFQWRSGSLVFQESAHRIGAGKAARPGSARSQRIVAAKTGQKKYKRFCRLQNQAFGELLCDCC